MLQDTDNKTLTARLYKCALAISRRLQPLFRLSRIVHSHRLQIIWSTANGYHFGVLCCAWISGVVLILNVSMTAWAASSNISMDAGIGTLQHGSCKRISNIGSWVHLVINALSTLLLGASNYTMQCLGSPSRTEIDEAHKKGSWLDVGVPSMGNLWKTATYRKILWWGLAVSTIPLHLLWNSAVFTSLSSYEYKAWVVPRDYPEYTSTLLEHGTTTLNCSKNPIRRNHPSDGYPELRSNGGRYFCACNSSNSPGAVHNSTPQYSWEGTSNPTTSQYPYPAPTSPPSLYDYSICSDDNVRTFSNLVDNYQTNKSTFERLSKKSCLERYVGPIVSDRTDVLLVSSYNSSDLGKSILFAESFGVAFSDYQLPAIESTGGAAPWICKTSDVDTYSDTLCDLRKAASRQESTVFQIYGVQSCWSQRAEERCQLQFSPVIMVSNLITISELNDSSRLIIQPTNVLGQPRLAFKTNWEQCWSAFGCLPCLCLTLQNALKA